MHEVGDDSVECRVLEAEALLAGAERAEVLGGLGHNVITELHNNATDGGIVGSHVEVDAGKSHFRWDELD